MKVSNKTNLTAGIILLLLAAFFSIALLLQPLDFGQFGPGKSNFLFVLGSILTGAYGFTSILIPVFLFVSAISCFASKWTARRSMRLLTAIFPFFTSFAAERLVKFFLHDQNFIAIKIALTITVAIMLIAIEFLVAGILADKISGPDAVEKSEFDAEDSEIEESTSNSDGKFKDNTENAFAPYSFDEPETTQDKSDESSESDEFGDGTKNSEENINVSLYEKPVPKEFTESEESEKSDDPFADVFDNVKPIGNSAEENTEIDETDTEIGDTNTKSAESNTETDDTNTESESEPNTEESVTEDSIFENTHDQNDRAPVSNAGPIITQEEYAALTGFDEKEAPEEIEWPDADEIKAKAGNAEGDISDFSDFDDDPYALADLDKKSSPNKNGGQNVKGESGEDEQYAKDESPYDDQKVFEDEEISIFQKTKSKKDDTLTLDSDFEESFSQYENLVDSDNEEDSHDSENADYEPQFFPTDSIDDEDDAFDDGVNLSYDEENVHDDEDDAFDGENSESDEKKYDATSNPEFFDVDLNASIDGETESQENAFYDSENLDVRQKSSLSSDIFDDMEDEIRREVRKEMLHKKYAGSDSDDNSDNSEDDSYDSDEISENSDDDSYNSDNLENDLNSDFDRGEEFYEDEINVPVVKTAAPSNSENVNPHRAAPKKAYKVPTELLEHYDDDQYWIIDEATKQNAVKLKNTLTDFGITAEVIGIKKGPVVTMYELEPAPGVRLSKIVSLQDNIALSLAASSVRIVAPIPGRAAVGIEVPNKKRSIVSFREMIEQDLGEFKKMAIPVVLGKDILGKSQIIDIAKTPHLLIAGATGAGKSVCVNSIILSILYKRSPQQVKMILVDPKVVELKLYNDIPHLLTPVITEPKRALQALHWCLCEMERRYALLDQMGVRDISNYNNRIEERKICTEKLPYIVIIIDEFADLMATSGRELESTVARLAAMSRAVGIHLVLATQRPSVNVITGLIKANIPSRIAFMVASRTDSNIIIDSVGAEKLLGKGDMLYASAVDPYPVRIQGTFESDNEVETVVDYVKTLGEPDYIDDEMFFDEEDDDDAGANLFGEGSDPLYEQAVDIVIQAGKASASYIQRRLKIGYNRAARLVEEMEERGIVGPANGSKPREIIRVPN